MKKIQVMVLAMLVCDPLAGCAGLHVSWNASYNMPQVACISNVLISCTDAVIPPVKQP